MLAIAGALACIASSFFWGSVPAQGPKPTDTMWPRSSATVTPTASSQIEQMIGKELVDKFRIEDVWACGDSVNECMMKEEPALILARVALGETPASPSDQMYYFWLIKLRSYLGFKNAGHYSGNRDMEARWGPPTSIAREALCVGGCQFEAVRATHGIYFPCSLSRYHQLRIMLCPTDEDLPKFFMAYQAAQYVLDAPLEDFPEEMIGYDNFRSPTITGPGQRNRPGGLLSQQFFLWGEIWRDEFKDDNEFWASWSGIWTSTPTSTSAPTLTATATMTNTPEPTPSNTAPAPTRVVGAQEIEVDAAKERKKMELTLDQFIEFIAAVLGGIIQVPLVDWLKSVLKVEGKVALALSYVAAVGLAIAGAALTGALGEAGDPFEMAILVLVTGQTIYKMLNPKPQTP